MSTPAGEPLRVGLLGGGVIGATHGLMLADIAQKCPGTVTLETIAEPIAAQRQLFVEHLGVRHGYADARELIERAEIDAVFVCTPTHTHLELVRAATARGLHVFCEKPLGMNLAEACEIARLVAAAGVQAQVGLVLRYSAVYDVMREFARDAAAGRPMAWVMRDDQCLPIRGLHGTPWRADPARTAGGTLIEHGIHDLDLVQWMFGPVRRLRASVRNLAGHPGIEDYAAVELELESGLHAQIVNVWHDMVQRPSNRRLEIVCERRFIGSEHDMAGPIEIQTADEAAIVLAEAETLARFAARHPEIPAALHGSLGASYLAQDLAFVQALRCGQPPSPGLADGIAAQRLAELAYRSAREDRTITLAEEPDPAP